MSFYSPPPCRFLFDWITSGAESYSIHWSCSKTPKSQKLRRFRWVRMQKSSFTLLIMNISVHIWLPDWWEAAFPQPGCPWSVIPSALGGENCVWNRFWSFMAWAKLLPWGTLCQQILIKPLIIIIRAGWCGVKHGACAGEATSFSFIPLILIPLPLFSGGVQAAGIFPRGGGFSQLLHGNKSEGKNHN